MTPTDTLSYTHTAPSASELDSQLFDEVYGQQQQNQNQKAGHFILQWMLERPEKTKLQPDELSMERVRRAHGRFMIVVTDEQAEQIAPLFRGDTLASQ